MLGDPVLRPGNHRRKARRLFDQEVPAGIQAQEPQQPNTGNENAANNNNNNNNNDYEDQDLPEELQRIVNATTAAGV